MWRYGVGHSQLLLRAVPDEVQNDCLDLLFEGVSAMKLATRFESIKISIAGIHEAMEIRGLAGLPDALAERSLALSLRSRKNTGLLVCNRATAFLGGDNPTQAPGVTAEHGEIWSIRGGGKGNLPPGLHAD